MKSIGEILIAIMFGVLVASSIMSTITLIKINEKLSKIKPQVTEVHTNNFPDTHFVDQIFRNVMEVHNNGGQKIDSK